jgi:5-(carboxyamino)imidazole ribonucleotide mutase
VPTIHLNQKAVVIMGSKSDLGFSEQIKQALAQYSISCDLRIASAHRTPEYLLGLLKAYYESGDQIVAVTVAGLSDALSGVVAAQRYFPVVACPPDLEKYQMVKVFSSAFTPSDVPVAFVDGPQKAAHFVAQIFALSNEKLPAMIRSKFEEKQRELKAVDAERNPS